MKEAFGFDVDQYIYFGGYPGSAMYINDERRWILSSNTTDSVLP